MTLSLTINGNVYEQFIGAEVTIGMDDLCRGFSFEATSTDPDPTSQFFSDAGEGATVKVSADGELVVSGVIELLTVAGTIGSHVIDLQGRDFTSSILDSTLGEIPDLIAPVSLETIAKKVIEHLGIENMSVINDLDLADFTNVEDQISPDVGDNAFEYLQAWARKQEVLLASNKDGNLLFTQPQPATSTTKNNYLRHKKSDDQNNVISYNMTLDSTGRYNAYIVAQQLNPTTQNAAGETSNEAITNQMSGTVRDSSIRLGRQFVLMSETAGVAASGTTRAEWEANIRKVRGRTYNCVVEGFRNQSGKLWTAGDLVFVDDDFAGISANMRINTVIFTMNAEGNRAQLQLLEPNAYTLFLETEEVQQMPESKNE